MDEKKMCEQDGSGKEYIGKVIKISKSGKFSNQRCLHFHYPFLYYYSNIPKDAKNQQKAIPKAGIHISDIWQIRIQQWGKSGSQKKLNQSNASPKKANELNFQIVFMPNSSFLIKDVLAAVVIAKTKNKPLQIQNFNELILQDYNARKNYFSKIAQNASSLYLNKSSKQHSQHNHLKSVAQNSWSFKIAKDSDFANLIPFVLSAKLQLHWQDILYFHSQHLLAYQDLKAICIYRLNQSNTILKRCILAIVQSKYLHIYDESMAPYEAQKLNTQLTQEIQIGNRIIPTPLIIIKIEDGIHCIESTEQDAQQDFFIFRIQFESGLSHRFKCVQREQQPFLSLKDIDDLFENKSASNFNNISHLEFVTGSLFNVCCQNEPIFYTKCLINNILRLNKQKSTLQALAEDPQENAFMNYRMTQSDQNLLSSRTNLQLSDICEQARQMSALQIGANGECLQIEGDVIFVNEQVLRKALSEQQQNSNSNQNCNQSKTENEKQQQPQHQQYEQILEEDESHSQTQMSFNENVPNNTPYYQFNTGRCKQKSRTHIQVYKEHDQSLDEFDNAKNQAASFRNTLESNLSEGQFRNRRSYSEFDVNRKRNFHESQNILATNNSMYSQDLHYHYQSSLEDHQEDQENIHLFDWNQQFQDLLVAISKKGSMDELIQQELLMCQFLSQFQAQALVSVKLAVNMMFYRQKVEGIKCIKQNREYYDLQQQLNLQFAWTSQISQKEPFCNSILLDKDSKMLINEMHALDVLQDINLQIKKQTPELLPKLRVPLACIIEYLGIKCFVSAKIPIQHLHTLAVGKSASIFVQDRQINGVLSTIANKLCLKPHMVQWDLRVSKQLVQTVFNNEAHYVLNQQLEDMEFSRCNHGIDKSQFYIIKNSELLLQDLPLNYCDSDNTQEDVQIDFDSYKKLRPELYLRQKMHFNSDCTNPAVSSVQFCDRQSQVKKIHQEQLELLGLAQQMRTIQIPALLKRLESLKCMIFDGLTLVSLLHEYGINIRYLGIIATSSNQSHIKTLCQSEMIARSAKKIYREHIRQFLFREENIKNKKNQKSTNVINKKFKTHQNDEIKSQLLQEEDNILSHLKSECVRIIIDFLNLIFGKSDESGHFWKYTLFEQIKHDFEGYELEFGQLALGGVLTVLCRECQVELQNINLSQPLINDYDQDNKQNQFKYKNLLGKTALPFDLTNFKQFVAKCKQFRLAEMHLHKIVSAGPYPSFAAQHNMLCIKLTSFNYSLQGSQHIQQIPDDMKHIIQNDMNEYKFKFSNKQRTKDEKQNNHNNNNKTVFQFDAINQNKLLISFAQNFLLHGQPGHATEFAHHANSLIDETSDLQIIGLYIMLKSYILEQKMTKANEILQRINNLIEFNFGKHIQSSFINQAFADALVKQGESQEYNQQHKEEGVEFLLALKIYKISLECALQCMDIRQISHYLYVAQCHFKIAKMHQKINQSQQAIDEYCKCYTILTECHKRNEEEINVLPKGASNSLEHLTFIQDENIGKTCLGVILHISTLLLESKSQQFAIKALNLFEDDTGMPRIMSSDNLLMANILLFICKCAALNSDKDILIKYCDLLYTHIIHVQRHENVMFQLIELLKVVFEFMFSRLTESEQVWLAMHIRKGLSLEIYSNPLNKIKQSQNIITPINKEILMQKVNVLQNKINAIKGLFIYYAVFFELVAILAHEEKILAMGQASRLRNTGLEQIDILQTVFENASILIAVLGESYFVNLFHI